MGQGGRLSGLVSAVRCARARAGKGLELEEAAAGFLALRRGGGGLEQAERLLGAVDVRLDADLVMRVLGRQYRVSPLRSINFERDMSALSLSRSTRSRRGMCCRGTIEAPQVRGGETPFGPLLEGSG